MTATGHDVSLAGGFRPKDKREILVDERVRKQITRNCIAESIKIAVSAVVIGADAVSVERQPKRHTQGRGRYVIVDLVASFTANAFGW